MKKNKKMLATIASVCAMACSLPVSAESASALPIKALAEKAVDANPYMASGDTNIHHDGLQYRHDRFSIAGSDLSGDQCFL